MAFMDQKEIANILARELFFQQVWVPNTAKSNNVWFFTPNYFQRFCIKKNNKNIGTSKYAFLIKQKKLKELFKRIKPITTFLYAKQVSQILIYNMYLFFQCYTLYFHNWILTIFGYDVVRSEFFIQVNIFINVSAVQTK